MKKFSLKIKKNNHILFKKYQRNNIKNHNKISIFNKMK